MSLKSLLYSSQFKARQRVLGWYYGATAEPRADSGALEPRRVLFVLAGLIGDSVMSFPAVAEARRLWPRAHIAVLGKTHNRELLAGCTEVDEFYVCDADPLSIRSSSEVKKLRQWLGGQDFDVAIILLGDQYAHLLAQAKIPVRVGVAGTLMEPCLTHTYEIGSPRTWGTNERLNALRCLGFKIESSVPSLGVDTQAREAIRTKLENLGLKGDEKFAVLHPFGSTRRQWWGGDKLMPLADSICKTGGLKTVLVGGGETKQFAIVSEPIIDTRGRLSLRELVAVIDFSEIVITTDSGPFHIAGALGKKTVGLFRSRRPEHAEAYRNAKVVFGENEVCQSNCDWDRCRGNPCRQMEDIKVESVFSTLVNQQTS